MEAVAPPTYNNDDYSQNEAGKREFLKRKSKKQSIPAAPPKKYNYYVDNFEEGKKKDKDQSAYDIKEPSQAKIQSYEVNAPSSRVNERTHVERP